MEERWDRLMYQRDMRLTGNPYQQNVSVNCARIRIFKWNSFYNSIPLTLQGLESIPAKE